MEPEDLYREYAEMIYRFLYLKCRDEDLAEDLVQTTFLKAITKLDDFRGECKVSTWLCQIAKNEYLNYSRKQNWQQVCELNEETGGNYVRARGFAGEDVILEKLIQSEQAGMIREILHNLSEPYREVFMLRVYGECSFCEIGEVFQKNDTWARVTYYRAKAKITEELRKRKG